LWWH